MLAPKRAHCRALSDEETRTILGPSSQTRRKVGRKALRPSWTAPDTRFVLTGCGQLSKLQRKLRECIKMFAIYSDIRIGVGSQKIPCLFAKCLE